MLQGEQESLVPAVSSGVEAHLPVGLYRRGGKRLMDIVFSGFGLLILAPLFLIVAVLTRLSSPGPAFFRQRRVGKNGKIFVIIKFRSMVAAMGQRVAPITASSDPRITPWGVFLRRHKIDELPQLWNVLKGDMSLVGPRPELEIYVQGYTLLQRRVLEVRPGITDAGSLFYRAEEKLLGMSGDPESYYVEHILPTKLALNVQYIENYNFVRDLVLIVKTVYSVFCKPTLPTI
jgi:lipopolysaccharide/colanic/teichoic acid biosynthesis glycosyltransferase